MQISELWIPYVNDCAHCGQTLRQGPLANFVHDLRCWSAKTAVYNLFFRLGVAVGIYAPAIEDDSAAT